VAHARDVLRENVDALLKASDEKPVGLPTRVSTPLTKPSACPISWMARPTKS
jgi:hypothetical protein